MNIVVTGGSGVLGFHLLNALQDSDAKIYSFSDRPPLPTQMVPKVNYCYGNLLSDNEIKKFINDVKPDEVYHIATQSSFSVAQKKPVDTLNTNIVGTHNLLDSLRKINPKCKVFLLSSGEVYGRGEGLLDILHEEDDKLKPLSPFATSKACMEMLAQQFYNAWGMNVIVGRPFLYTGPCQEIHHGMLPHVSSQLVDIAENNCEPVIYTGNIDVSRDIVDIRDLARAITLIMRSGKAGEAYNICTGEARTIREAIEMLILHSGQDVDIRIDVGLERQTDLAMVIGCPNKVKETTGWKPMISFDDSLADMYNDIYNRKMREKENTDYF